MTNVRACWTALVALWFIPSWGCGDTTGDNAGAAASGGMTGIAGASVSGGVETAGSAWAGNAAWPPTGGYLNIGANGGWSNTGGFLNAGTAGAWWNTGGFPQAGTAGTWPGTGGYSTAGAGTAGTWPNGGAPPEPPPNGATCLCRLAESVRVVGGFTAICSADDPNVCTLEKAYCGQTCAGDSGCALSCFDTFYAHVFDDAATYSYGSCHVIIRCPAPSS